MANLSLSRLRLQPSPRKALRLAHQLQIETVSTDQVAMLDLAEAIRLTSQDASSLWLARSLGGEQVMLGQKLPAASG